MKFRKIFNKNHYGGGGGKPSKTGVGRFRSISFDKKQGCGGGEGVGGHEPRRKRAKSKERRRRTNKDAADATNPAINLESKSNDEYDDNDNSVDYGLDDYGTYGSDGDVSSLGNSLYTETNAVTATDPGAIARSKADNARARADERARAGRRAKAKERTSAKVRAAVRIAASTSQRHESYKKAEREPTVDAAAFSDGDHPMDDEDDDDSESSSSSSDDDSTVGTPPTTIVARTPRASNQSGSNHQRRRRRRSSSRKRSTTAAKKKEENKINNSNNIKDKEKSKSKTKQQQHHRNPPPRAIKMFPHIWKERTGSSIGSSCCDDDISGSHRRRALTLLEKRPTMRCESRDDDDDDDDVDDHRGDTGTDASLLRKRRIFEKDNRDFDDCSYGELEWDTTVDTHEERYRTTTMLPRTSCIATSLAWLACV